MENDFKRWIALLEDEWQPVIDDDIPLPPPERGSGATLGSKFERRLPLRSMVVGQSMFVPEAISSYKKLTDRLNRLTANYGIRFAVRRRVEKEVEGVRVWRVS